MSEIKRKENESNLEYGIRLYSNKALYGLSNSEIHKLYCEECDDSRGESTIRGYFTNLIEGINLGIEQASNNDIVSEIEDKIKELEIEKIKIQDQKREYRALLRTDARFEHLKEEMLKAIESVKNENPLVNTYQGYEQDNEVHAVAIFSDWHFGIKEKNMFNEINVDILKQRVEKLTDDIIKYCHHNSVDTLHVEILGDMVNGLIHIGTRISNEEDVISQSMHCAEVICQALNKLAKYIPNIKVYTTMGNHGRVFANKKEQALDSENFERLIPWYIKGRLENNVELVESLIEDDEILVIKFLNETIFAVHGHNDKFGNAVTNLSKLLKVFPTEVHLGHFHAYKEFDDCDMTTTVNGTLSGTDKYAKSIRKSSKPMQSLMIYNNDGRVCTYKLKF